MKSNPNPYASTVVPLSAQPEATQSRRYPYVRVILGFSLLGGATGGAVLAVGTAFFGNVGGSGAVALLLVVLVFMTYGAFLGLLPALLCGVWLALWKTQRTAGGLLHAVLAGAVVSGLCMMLFTQDSGSAVLGLLGGAAAFLLGALLLPAPPEAA